MEGGLQLNPSCTKGRLFALGANKVEFFIRKIKPQQIIPSPSEVINYSFARKEPYPLFPFPVTGLSDLEETHTWSTKKVVTMNVPNFYEGKRVTNLFFSNTSALASDTYEQLVTVCLDQTKVGEYKYRLPHFPSHDINVPLPFTDVAERVLSFSIPTTTIVKNVFPENPDPRELGMVFRTVKVTFQKDIK